MHLNYNQNAFKQRLCSATMSQLSTAAEIRTSLQFWNRTDRQERITENVPARKYNTYCTYLIDIRMKNSLYHHPLDTCVQS